MTLHRDDILDGLGSAVTRGIKFMALADAIGARKADYAHMRALLATLVEEGVVRELPGGAFALAPHGRGADKKARAALPWREPVVPHVPATAIADAAPAVGSRPGVGSSCIASTSYEIAGKNIANPQSFINALKVAKLMAQAGTK